MAQERNPKRQRFSLGGPSGDTSFEDYLTGNSRHVSSSSEEDFDQENQDPQLNQEEDENEEEKEGEEEDFSNENLPPRPTHRPSTTSGTATSSSSNPVHNINNSIKTTSSTLAKNTSYHILIRLLMPNTSVPITRLLHLPATLLFEQLNQALAMALDWSGTHLWKFTLQTPPSKPLNIHATPDPRREIANIRDLHASHNLGHVDKRKDLDSKKVRLLDVWGAHQRDAVRKLPMFYTYDPYGDPWFHRVTFLGVAEEGLMASDMGVELFKKGQQVWCFGGSGAPVPKDVDLEDEFREEGDRLEWDVEMVNEELRFIEVEQR
ncbi:hypothetical protein AUEXF2481DRAFT_8824 [Aureobasidium subglaciale EXF-2481]|uniref:Plasmid pRiA4b Orf3-like domain-containing protein n=1 Tax=Aureobasidium subglaciale (strain EXF-2481) TaxID=1043005 RepID=A0A074Y0G4_AURSE|nr:uncharacterized protein AUEXF2481DRAFT_8824 [Aureobasidium subglaciale EXF-2481]KAI5207187.1 hypothetical protein E4T38_03484 [Aureobasidium subglaciale]KAI5226139.1 hypothetical protein E4T40_03138 [Aureobasidium subglaciale]KAI5229446.1 hypothetical protein E4T41_03481 [Aureobasidium subglaciale]KAI5264150.1 hypothetical protein E4T46_03258 [Aureobasidium subglaciale]KEQ91210.1 hypothetical protein AUEXF2481DRAFT_8824 [Aureobasidium subglaciale EXF-2481]